MKEIDVAILHVYLENVCGSLLDSIDYYINLREALDHELSVRLFLLKTNFSRNKFSLDGNGDSYADYIKYIIKDRFNDIDDSILDGVESLQIEDLRGCTIKTSIILDNHSFHMIHPFNQRSKYIFVVENFIPTRTRYDILEKESFNAIILNETCYWNKEDVDHHDGQVSR